MSKESVQLLLDNANNRLKENRKIFNQIIFWIKLTDDDEWANKLLICLDETLDKIIELEKYINFLQTI